METKKKRCKRHQEKILLQWNCSEEEALHIVFCVHACLMYCAILLSLVRIVSRLLHCSLNPCDCVAVRLMNYKRFQCHYVWHLSHEEVKKRCRFVASVKAKEIFHTLSLCFLVEQFSSSWLIVRRSTRRSSSRFFCATDSIFIV
jgi:hypothetical protein